MKNQKKLLVYVDESGQDTKGTIFIVGVLIVEEEKSFLQIELERIEEESGKRNLKWRKSNHESRNLYIKKILALPNLKNFLFVNIFRDSKEYIDLTSLATAKAILKKSGKEEYKATVFVDGLRKKEVEKFSRGLRDLRIRTRKVRGVKKDENNAFIRVVDALCGLVRDAHDNNVWAQELVRKLVRKKLTVIL